jgi:dUTP pyrophosphatase
MKVRFKKLHQDAVIPSYATPGDAGLDITCIAYAYNQLDNYLEYYTGLSVEIPEGYVGLLFPRSSISKTNLNLTNSVGVIDSGFRGELRFRYRFPIGYTVGKIRRYDKGDRVGQLVILPYPHIEPEEAMQLSDTVRGDGGFGSTGN